jgi:DNA-binding PucR family transcriptional regulator
VRSFEDLDLAGLALAQGSPAALAPKVAAIIEPLRRRPLFEEALRAYFAANLDVVKAAHALHLHHNSMRYRLAQIEKLLGVELRDPATIANLHLALLASSVMEQPAAEGAAPAAAAS